MWAQIPTPLKKLKISGLARLGGRGGTLWFGIKKLPILIYPVEK
ncbi:MAG: hypothetical protein ACFFBT_01080 [Promethearchaeota archaeon]